MRRSLPLIVLLALLAALWYGAGPMAGWRGSGPGPGFAAVDTPVVPMPPRGPAVCGGHCGTERWMVKTLSDRDRNRVRLSPVDATIEQLVALPRPRYLPPTGRAAPTELTVFRVEARLRALFTEGDHDYHLVLESPRDSTITMIAEVPDPECAGSCASGFAATFARVRLGVTEALDRPSRIRKPLVRVTGVAFFDFFHRQRGVAPNAIELHPVLAVELLPDTGTSNVHR